MRFLVDAQLPPALARWLVAAGHEAEHVGDVGLGDARDQAIWAYAAGVGSVIVSKDEESSQCKILQNAGPPIVWIRLPNTRRRELLVWFEAALPAMIEALERGESLIEVA
jgi:predicted nuclease of predicted toxin-antitoxin system